MDRQTLLDLIFFLEERERSCITTMSYLKKGKNYDWVAQWRETYKSSISAVKEYMDRKSNFDYKYKGGNKGE